MPTTGFKEESRDTNAKNLPALTPVKEHAATATGTATKQEEMFFAAPHPPMHESSFKPLGLSHKEGIKEGLENFGIDNPNIRHDTSDIKQGLVVIGTGHKQGLVVIGVGLWDGLGVIGLGLIGAAFIPSRDGRSTRYCVPRALKRKEPSSFLYSLINLPIFTLFL